MREYNIAELKSLIREAYLEVLTEDAESSNRKKARRLLKDKNYVTRDNFKAGDEEERIVINTLPDCVRYNNFKFAIFFYSLYYQYKDEVKVEKNADNENDKEYNEWEIINNYFYNILKEEGDNFNYAKYLTDIKNYTLIPLQDLLDIIEEYSSNREEEDNQEYNTAEYPYNGYKIIKITSFIQSQEYSPYCDWCVVKSKQLYNQYTNNGLYCFHFCLRYDFKDTNEPLSMLAVMVDEKGNLKQITTRANNGDHYYKTEQEVEKHFGIDNFSSVFTPITEDELKQAQEEEQKIKEDYQKNIKQYLKQGHNIEDILRKAYDWFEYNENIKLFDINNNKQFNYIDKEGNLIFKEWYDNTEYLEELDLFRVQKNNKYNYINIEDKLLFKQWYDWIRYDEDINLIKVVNNNKWNYIDREGNLLFNEWYDMFEYNYSIDLFRVKNNNKENYINKNGVLLSNNWYDEFLYNDYLKLFRIENNNKYNFINKEGNLLFEEWYDGIFYKLALDLFFINKNNKYNYIDREGKLLFEEWYDYIEYDEELNLFEVKNNKKYNYIDKQDKLLFTVWYDSIYYNNYLDLFLVIKDNKENYIDKQGNLLFTEWYDDIIYNDSSYLFYVKKNNKRYYIDINENIINV